MKLAIIIVTYQGESFLEGLFSTLQQHTDLSEAEIVVVDNASTDGTVAALNRLAQTWPNLHVLAADPQHRVRRGQQHRFALGARARLPVCVLAQSGHGGHPQLVASADERDGDPA